jgi:hypothetical protein
VLSDVDGPPLIRWARGCDGRLGLGRFSLLLLRLGRFHRFGLCRCKVGGEVGDRRLGRKGRSQRGCCRRRRLVLCCKAHHPGFAPVAPPTDWHRRRLWPQRGLGVRVFDFKAGGEASAHLPAVWRLVGGARQRLKMRERLRREPSAAGRARHVFGKLHLARSRHEPRLQ